MLVRFDIRPGATGWMVVDRRTRTVARVDEAEALGLEEEDAGEIADLLNTLDFLRRGTPVH